MNSVSAGHFLLTPDLGSSSRPPHQDSCALPSELPYRSARRKELIFEIVKPLVSAYIIDQTKIPRKHN